MNDEIKEILDKLRSDDYYEKEYQKSVYYERDLKKLEDYITNLQQELEDYKSCCENLLKSKNKVLKYIKNYCGMELRYRDKDVEDRLLTIKDILNGRSDE